MIGPLLLLVPAETRSLLLGPRKAGGLVKRLGNGAFIRSIRLADPAEETGNNYLGCRGSHQLSTCPELSSFQSAGNP